MIDSTVGGTVLNLTERDLDEKIYRIMPEDYVMNIFKDRENVLSQVHNWKDKFENFQLKLGGVLNGEPFEYNFRDDFVGQCWTRESLSEAMWGIYASDANLRYLRIRSTPRRLLTALASAHANATQDTCFIGKVMYKREGELRAYVENGGRLELGARRFAESLLLKRASFKHEKEVRLIFFGNSDDYCEKGLYRYSVDPHSMITQIMADPNRDRTNWKSDQARIRSETGFIGEIKRSKIYDAPDWATPTYFDQT
ncbi:hypothetical protein [Mameliella sp.]|uniref:hypothetical protein n=1 Tax=Mameliella sp. TaxID=1924940 RepID=UPI003BAB2CC5